MAVVLKSRLPMVSARLDSAVGDALRISAKAIERDAKARVPVRSGDLRRAIHTRREDLTSYAVVAGNNDVFYGHMVEFGTSHSAPHAFLVPALEENRGLVTQSVAAALRDL